MNETEAAGIRPGDLVMSNGVPCRVLTVTVGGIAGPHFRLTPLVPVTEGLRRDLAGRTSYKLCRVPTAEDLAACSR